jgi:hypothetical protein
VLHAQLPFGNARPLPLHVTTSLNWQALPAKPGLQPHVPLPVMPSLHTPRPLH